MFDVFRRHQKKWMAALAIMAMIAFSFPASRCGDLGSAPEQEAVAVIFGRAITEMELQEAEQQRTMANSFVLRCRQAIGDPLALVMAEQLIESVGFGAPTRESLLQAMALEHLADQMNVVITDEMVEAWIKQITDGRLSTEQFRSVIASLGIDEMSLYDMLRRQLRIQRVPELTLGRQMAGTALVTPLEAWHFYRKLHERISFDLIPVPAAKFTDQVAEPDEATLRKLFNQYADRLPDPDSPQPGFKEPHKVQLQYAYAAIDEFLTVFKPEVTEEEVKQEYKRNKELYRIVPAEKSEPEAKEAEQRKPEGSRKERGSQPEPQMNPSNTKTLPAKHTPQQKKPAEDKQKGQPQRKKQASPESNKVQAKDNPEPVFKVAAQEQASATNQRAKARNASDSPQPAAASQSSSQKHAGKKPAEEAGKKNSESASEGPKPGQQTEQTPSETEEQQPRYRPLEEVRNEIRDRLARDKARSELIGRLRRLAARVNDFAIEKYLPAKEQYEAEKENSQRKELKFVPPEPPELAAPAKQLGLEFQTTDLVPVTELDQLPDLGQARQLLGEEPDGDPLPAAIESDELFDPREFGNPETDSYFVVWKCQDVPEHTPQFKQVRAKVLAAYKLIEARKLARKRAEELADQLRKSRGELSKLTAKFKELEDVVSVKDPVPLWSTAPQLYLSSFAPPKVIQTEIPGLESPGEKIYQTTFELNEGEIAVAANQAETVFYVIIVRKRKPASRELFAQSAAVTERQLQMRKYRQVMQKWLEQFRHDAGLDKLQAIKPAAN